MLLNILKLQEYSNEPKNKSEIHVEIIDFGIGIPEEDQPKLFNTFYRASNRKELREQVWASILLKHS
jgi:signal transduction histidine kinase